MVQADITSFIVPRVVPIGTKGPVGIGTRHKLVNTEVVVKAYTLITPASGPGVTIKQLPKPLVKPMTATWAH